MNHDRLPRQQEDKDQVYMDRLDELVDRLNIPYHEAKKLLGPVPYDEYETRTQTKEGDAEVGPDAIGDEDPFYYRRYAPDKISSTQREINRSGIDLAKRALHTEVEPPQVA